MTVKIKDLQAMQKELPTTKAKVEDFNNIKITIQQYLPLETKMVIAEQVYEICAVDNNGFKIANHTLKNIVTDILIIKNYTDVKVQENLMAAYDLINSIGLNEFVKGKLPQRELWELRDTIDNKIFYEEKKQEREINKIEYEKSLQEIVENFLNGLLAKIPDKEEQKAMFSDVQGLLSDKPELMGLLKKFADWNNGVDINGNKVI